MATNNQPNAGFDSKEGERRSANAFRVGKIVEARYDDNKDGEPPKNNDNPYFHNKDVKGNYRGPLYRVVIGDHKPYWIPQLHLRCGKDQEYWAHEVGDQVVVLCDSGDPMQSFIIGAVPSDANRPPVGHDDLSADKRPWRETVHRIRYEDGMIAEYDRYLHRRLAVFNDGTMYTDWFLDDREDRSARKKETNSDKSGTPPRHWRNRKFPDGSDHEFLWDEDVKIHRKHWKFPDVAVFEYEWDEENKLHTDHTLYADKTDYSHAYDENSKTHTQTWMWADGYKEQYLWDESAKHHHYTVNYADGTVKKYHWSEEKQSKDEVLFADGTQIIFQFPDPHHFQINFSDGSHVRYDIASHKLTAKLVGTADIEVVDNVSLTCGANLTADVTGNVSVSAQGTIEVSSEQRVTLSAPVIVLNGLASGKNVQFNGNFGFAGDVEIDGRLDTTQEIESSKAITSRENMFAPGFSLIPD